MLNIRRWDMPQPYTEIWQAMRAFTDARTPTTPDALWLLEHPAVFTQGLAGKPEHVGDIGMIPLVQSDRGGQVTYHGPGILMIYWLFDLKRAQCTVREAVCYLEGVIIAVLASYGITAHGDRSAPGVYVGNAKIASIGLRVRHGASYHGACLNINGDLSPFLRINPCGVPGRPITQIQQYCATISRMDVEQRLIRTFQTTSVGELVK